MFSNLQNPYANKKEMFKALTSNYCWAIFTVVFAIFLQHEFKTEGYIASKYRHVLTTGGDAKFIILLWSSFAAFFLGYCLYRNFCTFSYLKRNDFNQEPGENVKDINKSKILMLSASTLFAVVVWIFIQNFEAINIFKNG